MTADRKYCSFVKHERQPMPYHGMGLFFDLRNFQIGS